MGQGAIMQARPRKWKFLTFLLLAGLVTSCNFYPAFSGWDLQIEVQGGGADEQVSSRLIAPESRRIRVELWRDGVLDSRGEAVLSAPASGQTAKGTVRVSGVLPGSYEVRAFALDAAGVSILAATGKVDLLLTSETPEITLRLIPNEAVAGNVLPLTVGKPSDPVNLVKKTTRFLKLDLGTLPAGSKLWSSVGPEFTTSVQNSAGEVIPASSLLNTQPALHWVHYFYDGSIDQGDYSFYLDIVDVTGAQVDRRDLWEKYQSAKVTEKDAETNRGTAIGQFPADASKFEAQLTALKAELAKADLLLPPNYTLLNSSLAPAVQSLLAATVALEGRRITAGPPPGGKILSSQTGVWMDFATGDSLVALAGTAGQVRALDSLGRFLTWDLGIWTEASGSPGDGLNLLAAYGSLYVAAKQGTTQIRIFDGLTWKDHVVAPAPVKSLTAWPDGIAVLTDAGQLQSFDGSVWTNHGAVPAGVETLSVLGVGMVGYSSSDVKLWTWDGSWTASSLTIPLKTGALAGTTDAILALIQN